MNIGRMNRYSKHTTYCIHYNMSLPPFDPFPPIKARFQARFRGAFHTLAVTLILRKIRGVANVPHLPVSVR